MFLLTPALVCEGMFSVMFWYAIVRGSNRVLAIFPDERQAEAMLLHYACIHGRSRVAVEPFKPWWSWT